MTRLRFPAPANEDEWEEFCLVLVREARQRPGLVRYGRRGERQHGVDLLDVSGAESLLAVQCKFKDFWKTLPPSELEEEVTKASSFPDHKINHYLVLTSGKRSTATQRMVRKLNKQQRACGGFTVEVLFWEEVQDLIHASPSALQLIRVHPPTGAQVAMTIAPVTSGDAPKFEELSEAQDLLIRGEVAEALLVIKRVRRKSWAALAPRQRAQVATLQADAVRRSSFGLSSDAEVAGLLEEAWRCDPENEVTLVNVIQARLLLKGPAAALAVAEEAHRKFPRSASALAARIELAADGQVEPLLASADAVLVDDPRVLVAVSFRSELGEKAIEAATRAAQLAPDDDLAWFAKGMALLRSEARPNASARSGDLASRQRRLDDSADALAKAIELAAKEGRVSLQARALMARAQLQELTGAGDLGTLDLAHALQMAPNDAEIIGVAARRALESRDYQRGLDLLSRVGGEDSASLEMVYIAGLTLWNRNQDGDRTRALNALSRVSRAPGTRRDEAAIYAVEGLALERGADAAAAFLQEIKGSLDTCLVNLLSARVSSSAAADIDALLTRALEARTPHTSRFGLQRLAAQLVARGRYAEALSVLTEIATPFGPLEVSHDLVHCAVRLGQHGLALEYCESWRKAGVVDDYLLDIELRVRERYDPESAIALLLSFDHGALKLWVKIRLLLLALKLGRDDVLRAQADDLPPADSVDAEQGAIVVECLRQLGLLDEAVRYAYELLRNHSSDHRAHRAFRNAMLHKGTERTYVPPETVQLGTAVLVEEVGPSSQHWYVIEAPLVGDVNSGEYLSPDSALAAHLIGKKLDDEFDVAPFPGASRIFKIKGLASKYARRYQDVMDGWQLRFPEHPELMVIRLGKDAGGETEFGRMFEVMRQNAESGEAALAVYQANPMPIATFAKLTHSNEMETMMRVARHQSALVRCVGLHDLVSGDPVRQLHAASEIVVDATALTTIFMLGRSDVLEALNKRVLISHSTMSILRAFGGRDFGGETQAISDLIRRCETFCSIVGVPEAAYFDADQRTEIETVAGTGVLDSMVLASLPNRVFWTDDASIAEAARTRVGARRVWTQTVLDWLCREGKLETRDRDRATALLVGWGYEYTTVTSRVLRECGEMSGWIPTWQPLRQAIELLGLNEITPSSAANLAAELVSDGYRCANLIHLRRNLLLAVLSRLESRSDFTSASFEAFKRLMERFFGLNQIGLQDALDTAQSWRRSRFLDAPD